MPRTLRPLSEEQKAKRREYLREYRLKNRSKIVEYDRKYREDHRTACNEASNKYYHRNKGQILAKAAEHKDEKYAYDKVYREITVVERTAAKKRDHEHHKERLREARAHLGGKCNHCGNTDMRVMHFDHIIPATKECAIGKITGCCDAKFWAEVAKCQLLCANCHMIKTANDRTSHLLPRPGLRKKKF